MKAGDSPVLACALWRNGFASPPVLSEVCCLKISNLGGISKACCVRGFLIENRMPVVSEDTCGGGITSTVVAHFAASTPAEYLQNSTDLMNYNTRSTGIGGAFAWDGKLYAADTPGLGMRPDYGSLGASVAVYGGNDG